MVPKLPKELDFYRVLKSIPVRSQDTTGITTIIKGSVRASSMQLRRRSFSPWNGESGSAGTASLSQQVTAWMLTL